VRNKFILLVLLILAGCATSPPITTVVVQPNAPVAVPDTQPLTLNSVQWQVMSLDQLKKLVALLQASPQHQQTFFSLDTDNYNNLTLNLIEIQRYIEEQKAVLTMLKNIIAARSAAPAPMGAVTP
jgi:hypothetical protein